MRPLLSLRAIVYGLLLMLYFGICNVYGVADKIELRFFNFVILGIGLWTTLYSRARKGEEFGLKFFSGLKDGVLFSFTASFVFAVTFFLYLWVDDFALVDQLVRQGVINESISALHLSALIVVENVAAGAMMSFAMMQYLKYSYKSGKELKNS